MTRLFLIRHGEPESAWGGSADDPGLSNVGWKQAEAAARALSFHRPLQITTSPMRRCQETAAPLARSHGVTPRIEPRVSEVAAPPGTADRRIWLLETFPWRGGPARRWDDLHPDLKAWRTDVLEWAEELNEDSAVFTHFIAINVIVGAALNRGDTIVCKPAYASITEFDVHNGVLRLVRVGEEMSVGEVG